MGCRTPGNQQLPSMTEVPIEIAPAGPVSVVFFDFDDTLSSAKFIKRHKTWALADRPQVCDDLSDDEVLANFGGAARVSALVDMMRHLRASSVELRIISLGFSHVIRRHLEIVGLLEFFAGVEQIFGRDSAELVKVRGKKAHLIEKLCKENGWRTDRALFVDDDDRHITLCRSLGTCPFIKVRGHGLDLQEIEAIRSLAAARSDEQEPGGKVFENCD
mmetsp:Transcript_37633/g.66923  ORF Transcript_37633/g.66923 Transcript_37633/m.66923 type:complete len:217 (+) Transcript_37633:199-849(+)